MQHRITSTRLRQIISEEVRRFLAEADGEAEVPVGKKMVQAAQGMVELQAALNKFRDTSPDAAAAVDAQLADLESILGTKLEPLASLVSPSPSPSKFAGPQGLHSPPHEEEDEDEEGEY